MCGNRSQVKEAQTLTQQQMDLSNQQAQKANALADIFQSFMNADQQTRNNMLSGIFGGMGGTSDALQSMMGQAWGMAGQPMNVEQFNGPQLPGLPGYALPDTLGNDYTLPSQLPGYALPGGLPGYAPVSKLKGFGQTAGGQTGQALGDYKLLAEGLTPEAMTSLRGQALDRTPAQFDTARQALAAKMGARGFGGEGGLGTLASQFGGLESAKQQAIADALRNITLTDEQLRNQNLASNRDFLMNRDLLNAQLGMQQGLANTDIEKWNTNLAMQRDLANTDLAKWGVNTQMARDLANADILMKNAQFGLGKDVTNQELQKWAAQFQMQRDLANAGLQEQNRQYNLTGTQANRNWALQQRQADLASLLGAAGIGNNIFGNLLGQGGLVNQTYNPYQWGQLGVGALGAGNQAYGTAMQGAGINAQAAAQSRGFWDSIVGPLIGGGFGMLGSYLKGDYSKGQPSGGSTSSSGKGP